MKYFIQVLKYAKLRYNLFIAILLLLGSFKFKFFSPFLFLFLSNFYDAIGFYIVLKRRWSLGGYYYVKDEEKFYVAGYRIIQNMFDYLLLFNIFYLFGFKYALAGFILKWFAVQDVLFYIVLDVKFPQNWTWLEWTPLGILLKGQYLKHKLVIFQALLGVVISIIITILL